MSVFEERCGSFLCRGCGYRQISGRTVFWRRGRCCKACRGKLIYIPLEEVPLIRRSTGDALPGAYLCNSCKEFVSGESLTRRHWDHDRRRFRCARCRRPFSWIERLVPA